MSDVPAFRIEREPAAEGVALLVLAGEIDLATSSRFSSVLDEARADGPRAVVADLSEVEFMDSTMLRELLRAQRELDEAGVRLVLAGVQPTIARLLELTATTSLFELAPTRDEALARLD